MADPILGSPQHGSVRWGMPTTAVDQLGPSAAAVECQETLRGAQDVVAATTMQLSKWGLTDDAVPLAPRALALLRRKEQGRDGTGVDKLFAAAKGGKGALSVHELTVALTKAGPESRGWSGQTALHVAARSNFVEGTQLLLAHGFDIEAVDGRGLTPVGVAARHGAAAAAAALIDAGAEAERPAAANVRRHAISHVVSLSRRALQVDAVGSAMAIALESVPTQPLCIDVAEVLAQKGCTVPPSFATTALLLAVQNQLPHLRMAAETAVEWRGALPIVIHALDSHEHWSVAELRNWLEQHAGNRCESDTDLTRGQSEEELRVQVKAKCQQSLQDLLAPQSSSTPLMTPVRSSTSDTSMGFDTCMYTPEKKQIGHRRLGQGLVRRPEGFVASPVLSDKVQRHPSDENVGKRHHAEDAVQGEEHAEGSAYEKDVSGVALKEETNANHEETSAKDSEGSRAQQQRLVQYVAEVEAQEAEARAAAKSATKQLLDLHSAAKAIWSPPPLVVKAPTGPKSTRVWEAHDGPAPVRYGKQAAAVAACRGLAARHRVLARMIIALEQEVRERHWAATGLSGPMLRTGVYADYRALIQQSAQDIAWIDVFDAKWKKRAKAAEQAAKADAGLHVQVIPNPETFETVVRETNGLNNGKVCPWELDMAELAGSHARVITRPPTPPQLEATSGKEKYVAVILNEDGRKMNMPEFAIRLIPAEYQTEGALRDAKPFLKTGWDRTCCPQVANRFENENSNGDGGRCASERHGTGSKLEQIRQPVPDHLPVDDPKGWEDGLEHEKKLERDMKARTVIRTFKDIVGGKGGKGWQILHRTVAEETSSGNDWREWKQEPDYEGYDAVKVKNVLGVTVGLEGGWDGRDLGLGGGTHIQPEAAKKWKQQAIEKRRGEPTNSFFGHEIGSTRQVEPPSPDSPAIIANKWARKAAEERRAAAAAAKQQAILDCWGGTPPRPDELTTVAQIRKDKRNVKKERGKGVKGTGAPLEGMFMAEKGIKTTTGPHDPNDAEGGATELGWLHKGDVIAITKMQGLTSGTVVGKIAGANRGWIVVLDQYGKTKLLRISRPTALERAQYEVEKDELANMQARLAKSDAGAGAVRRQAIADAGAKADALRERISEMEAKILASSVLGRKRARYKVELRELDHELERIEVDKRTMEDGGIARRMLVEEILRQEEVVNDLRFRVEAEDKLIELQNVANVERKRARKEEKMREAEEARLREAAEVALIKQRQSRKQLTALGIHIDSPNGSPLTTPESALSISTINTKRRGAVMGSDAFACTDDAEGKLSPGPNLRRRGAVTGLLQLPAMSTAESPIATSVVHSGHSSAFTPHELDNGALSAHGMQAALRIARSYTPDRFDEILIRELGKVSRKAAEEAARAENAAQMERFRKLNRLTHELAHHGLPRNVQRWDTAASLQWLGAIGLRGPQVNAVVQLHGLDGDGLLFSDPAVLGRLFRPAWLSADVPEPQIKTRIKALVNALDYLRTEVAGLPTWTAKVELPPKNELDEWGRTSILARKHMLLRSQRMMQGLASGTVVEKIPVLDQSGKTKLLRISRPTALERAQYEVYKVELMELDHELDRIEVDKRTMEDGGIARRMLIEEISRH